MWTSKPLDSIFGEDGYLYLSEAMRFGFYRNLTTPYNGYLQVLPRLLAELVARLPVNWFAGGMAISGAIVVTGCGFVVWWASAGHIHSPILRGVLAALVVLLPIIGQESFDNVVNSIWYLAFACFWVLLWRPWSFLAAIAGAGVLLIATLSDGGVILFLPLWALRALAVKDRRDAVIVGAFAMGLGIQLALSWRVIRFLGEPGWLAVPS